MPLALYFRLADEIAGSLIGDLADLDLAVRVPKNAIELYAVADGQFRAAKIALETWIARTAPSVAAVAQKLVNLYKLEAAVAADLALAGPLPHVAATPTKKFLPSSTTSDCSPTS